MPAFTKSETEPPAISGFHFVIADSIAFLNSAHWDHVSARSGLFLSRLFLYLLEQHLPENLCTHYAIVIKDLTSEQAGAAAALRKAGFRRFETEPAYGSSA